MRTLTQDTLNALALSSYKLRVRSTLQPTQMYFDALTSDFPWAGADTAGIHDDAAPQEIGYCPNALAPITILQADEGLAYTLAGSSTVTSLGVESEGKPGLFGANLFYLASNHVYSCTLDWATIAARSGQFHTQPQDLGAPSPSGTALHIHAVSATACVVLLDDDGGIRPTIWASGVEIRCPSRFMFPSYLEYSPTRSMSSLALFSAALQLGTRIYVYISNHQTGSVEGIYYDTATSGWSDTFIAVATNLPDSKCEFRATNAYVLEGVAYLCGQFHRTENVGTDLIYTMILPSTSATVFAIDRTCMVSALGYRFQATVYNHDLFLGHCNRICSDDATYTFDHATDQTLVISTAISFQDTNCQTATLTLPVSNELYMFHAFTRVGSRVVVEIGYNTQAGGNWEWYTHGTYIIDGISSDIADAERGLTFNLVNESEWRLTGLYSPYYTEIFSKSSIYDPLAIDSGNMSAATQISDTKTILMVDFWKHLPWSNGSIVGINMQDGGGTNFYEAAAHPNGLGIVTPELNEAMGLDENPKITATSLDVRLFGWSRSNDAGSSVNDNLRVALITTDEAGTETVHLSEDDPQLCWHNTWPTVVTHYYPAVVPVTGLTVGHRLKKIAVVFVSANATAFNIARAEILTGTEVPASYDDSNTPWTKTNEGWELPGYGRPYIMFSQYPFNAYNFKIAAHFECSIQNAVATYPAAVGLIGLAEDGNNFILGRYNRSGNVLELVKVRNGVQTVLATESVAQFDEVDLMLSHQDGHFSISLRSQPALWYEELTYDWTAADGWMYTSDIVSTRCGIYGHSSAPAFRICGFNLGEDENSINADGIGMLPGESITDFPASGTVIIDETTYTYASKINPPQNIRGPYQFRQNGVYSPPWGNGSGMEIRDYDEVFASNALNGYLACLDDGAAYIISEILSLVATSTGGTTTYHRNRMRLYSNNLAIGTSSHFLTNRVWVTGGLGGVYCADSNAGMHSTGSLCQLKLSGRIACTWFVGASGNADSTIQDLIDTTSSIAGAKAVFPGNFTNGGANFVVAGSGTLTTLEYTDGLDLRFSTATSVAFTVHTSIVDSRYPTDTGNSLMFTIVSPGLYSLAYLSTPSNTYIETVRFSGGTGAHNFRVLYHNNFATFYMDGKWIYTFCIPEFTYPDSNPLVIQGTLTLTNIVVQEIPDWREAIYIDLETDSKAAIASIIQERPIETNWLSDGSISYYYTYTRTPITQTIQPIRHNWVDSIPRDCASDALIYSAEKVQCYQYQDFAEAYGFATKLYHFPNLYAGAVKATLTLLLRLYQSRVKHSLQCRVDERLEKGDVLALSYTASSTGRVVDHDILIESIVTSIQEGNYNQAVQGRQA